MQEYEGLVANCQYLGEAYLEDISQVMDTLKKLLAINLLKLCYAKDTSFSEQIQIHLLFLKTTGAEVQGLHIPCTLTSPSLQQWETCRKSQQHPPRSNQKSTIPGDEKNVYHSKKASPFMFSYHQIVEIPWRGSIMHQMCGMKRGSSCMAYSLWYKKILFIKSHASKPSNELVMG